MQIKCQIDGKSTEFYRAPRCGCFLEEQRRCRYKEKSTFEAVEAKTKACTQESSMVVLMSYINALQPSYECEVFKDSRRYSRGLKEGGVSPDDQRSDTLREWENNDEAQLATGVQIDEGI